MITAVSPEDTLEGELPGERRPEVRLVTMDMGLLEAVVSEVHPASAEGHPWVGVPEAEDLMVEVSGAVAAEVHYVSEAPRLEGRGRSAGLTALSIPKGFPERCFSLIGSPLTPP